MVYVEMSLESKQKIRKVKLQRCKKKAKDQAGQEQLQLLAMEMLEFLKAPQTPCPMPKKQ